MSKPISEIIQASNIGAAPPQEEDMQAGVKGLFMLFHAWYGTLLLARYNTGDVGPDGKDRGIKSAMLVWQKELDAFDGDIVRAAAERCKIDHLKYPPTLPEFVAICKAISPRVPTPKSQFAIPMSDGLKSSYSARERAKVMAAYQSRINASVGLVAASEDLSGLHVLVAHAVGLAGGDEMATLRRLHLDSAKRKQNSSSEAARVVSCTSTSGRKARSA